MEFKSIIITIGALFPLLILILPLLISGNPFDTSTRKVHGIVSASPARTLQNSTDLNIISSDNYATPEGRDEDTKIEDTTTASIPLSADSPHREAQSIAADSSERPDEAKQNSDTSTGEANDKDATTPPNGDDNGNQRHISGDSDKDTETNADSSSQTPTDATNDATTTTTTNENTSLGGEEAIEPVSTIVEPECLNKGKKVIGKDGIPFCLCPDGFEGNRCQKKNNCRRIFGDGLNGDEICKRIGRECIEDDKLFRCRCEPNEYFIFKADYYGQPGKVDNNNNNSGAPKEASPSKSIDYDSLLPHKLELPKSDSQQQQQQQQATAQPKSSYLAECRPINKCLGVRCRQNSELCHEGQCICNQDLGYIRDPADQLCKLLDPCQMATDDGLPRCGQAKCVASYDRELYKCICPIGYKPVREGENKSTTKCAILKDTICKIPLLNKCQHVCNIDKGADTYRCSCLPGYKPGSRPGLDDHMCFFDEHLDSPALDDDVADDYDEAGEYWGRSVDTGTYQVLDIIKGTDDDRGKRKIDSDGLIAYDPAPGNGHTDSGGDKSKSGGAGGGSGKFNKIRNFRFRPISSDETIGGGSGGGGQSAADGKRSLNRSPTGKWHNAIIKLEFIDENNHVINSGGNESVSSTTSDDMNPAAAHHRSHGGGGAKDHSYLDDDWDFTTGYSDLSSMSAQDRCNMYCEENKICVLNKGTRDSYRCECDRQGYVSVGDKCLDWCSAAEFNHFVQSHLVNACYSGICKQLDQRPTAATLKSLDASRANYYYGTDAKSELEREILAASVKSSWRPAFECDCSNSPLLSKDPRTHLCTLNFDEILKPCLPGNEGYIDCVENKHSYCVVLHQKTRLFLLDLISESLKSSTSTGPGAAGTAAASGSLSSGTGSRPNAAAGGGGGPGGQNKKLRPKEKLYTCVCSPEKKFLVDKPRKKARCINECDLLSNECGRFNRMCRPATIESHEDFMNMNLIKFERDGMRMNQFERTGCECLPGFNVGPKEARVFTLDDNYRAHDDTPGSELAYGNVDLTTLQRFQVETHRLVQDMVTGEIKTLLPGELTGAELEQLRIKYMNINSRCLLDYDVVEFHATFKAPADFEPAWVKVTNTRPLIVRPVSSPSPPSTRALATPAPSGSDASPSTVSPPIKDIKSPQPVEESLQPPKSSARSAGSSGGGGGKPRLLKVPAYMRYDVGELHKHVVMVAQCDYSLAQLSFDAYERCLRYRYWLVQKLRRHFTDWRRVMSNNLEETFDLMDGNIRFRVNKCEATIKRMSTVRSAYLESLESGSDSDRNLGGGGGVLVLNSTTTAPSLPDAIAELFTADTSTDAPMGSSRGDSSKSYSVEETIATQFDPLDQYAKIDADVNCELTIHSASDDPGATRRHFTKVFLEKQLPKLIFKEYKLVGHDEQFERLFVTADPTANNTSATASGLAESQPGGSAEYYLLAPNTLIHHESFDKLAYHQRTFNPCKSDYAYCDSQTRCDMIDTVNYTCTCKYGFTPIGSRDIYVGDSRKEVCEDIDECLFDVCKENGLENKSTCINEIGDYRCQCARNHVGDNKRYCQHLCNVIPCKYGDCRIYDEHHAQCECHEGYREADCSVQDPSVALRKANMIIVGSIFTSVLLLAITLAISLNSQLKKTKKKLKRLEAAQDAVEFYELSMQQQPPFGRKRVSKTSIGS